MHGKEINLTGDNTTITSTNFSVDKNGNMTCNNADIKGDIKSGSTITTQKFTVDESGKMSCQDANIQGNIEAVSGNIGNFEINNGWLYATSDDNIEIQLNGNGLNWNKHSGTTTYTLGNLQVFNDNTNINLTRTDGNTSYLTVDEVTAREYNNLSTETEKKNIEKFIDSALKIVKNTDIYKYNYKNENEEYKKHIGVVIGDNYKYSKEITNNNNNAINTYAMISILWKAVQEQQEQIEQLQKEIKELKEEK